jgi:hypothetical protein
LAGDSVATGYRRRASSLLAILALGVLQRFEIVAVARSLTGALHCQKMLKRADAHFEAIEVDLGRIGIENIKRGHLREPLQNIDVAQLGYHQGAIPRSEKGRDCRFVKRSLANLHPSTQLPQQRVEPREVLSRRIRNHIHIPGPAQITPRVDRKSTDQDEANLRPRQPFEQFP